MAVSSHAMPDTPSQIMADTDAVGPRVSDADGARDGHLGGGAVGGEAMVDGSVLVGGIVGSDLGACGAQNRAGGMMAGGEELGKRKREAGHGGVVCTCVRGVVQSLCHISSPPFSPATSACARALCFFLTLISLSHTHTHTHTGEEGIGHPVDSAEPTAGAHPSFIAYHHAHTHTPPPLHLTSPHAHQPPPPPPPPPPSSEPHPKVAMEESADSLEAPSSPVLLSLHAP